MTKQIGISDEVYQELKGMKKGDLDSFTKVIESLLIGDAVLNEINKHFKSLEALMPNLEKPLEYIREGCIQFYQLPMSDQVDKKEDVSVLVATLFDEAMGLIE